MGDGSLREDVTWAVGTPFDQGSKLGMKSLTLFSFQASPSQFSVTASWTSAWIIAARCLRAAFWSQYCTVCKYMFLLKKKNIVLRIFQNIFYLKYGPKFKTKILGLQKIIWKPGSSLTHCKAAILEVSEWRYIYIYLQTATGLLAPGGATGFHQYRSHLVPALQPRLCQPSCWRWCSRDAGESARRYSGQRTNPEGILGYLW